MLRYIFIVSQVEIDDKSADGVSMGIKVEKAEGGKCQRCWNYSSHVGRDKIHPTLCERCVETVSQ
jgi:isoleucyl-tRNA synthetase